MSNTRDDQSKEKQSTGNTAIQFGFGFFAATAFVVTGKPLVNPDKEYSSPQRQRLHKELEERRQDSNVQKSPEAIRIIEMVKGQNAAQDLFGHDLPETTIKGFTDQIDRHVQIDMEKLSLGQNGASPAKHAKVDIKHHGELAEQFRREGYEAGYYLHKVGVFQSEIKHSATRKVSEEKQEAICTQIRTLHN